MATDSTRKNAIAQLVAVLASCTAGADYFYTLTGERVVASIFDLDDRRIDVPGPVTLRVRDGTEEHRRRFQIPEQGATAELKLMVDVLVKHTTGDSPNLINEMQDAIHDVLHVVSKNRSLNGAVNDAYVDHVDEPIYDMEQNLAAALVRVHCEYDYLPSVTT